MLVMPNSQGGGWGGVVAWVDMANREGNALGAKRPRRRRGPQAPRSDSMRLAAILPDVLRQIDADTVTEEIAQGPDAATGAAKMVIPDRRRSRAGNVVFGG